MSKTLTAFAPSLEALLDFHKANLEACLQAQAVLLKGTQEISRELMAQAQAQFDALAAASRTALAAKTLKDVAALNLGDTKSSYEALVAASTRLNELGLQVANDAFEPIKARAVAATQKLMTPVAA